MKILLDTQLIVSFKILNDHNFEAPRAIVMFSSSFESSKPYLFAQYFENSISFFQGM